MRSIAIIALIGAAIATGGCNTIHGVGRDFSSLKEVVPHGSRHAAADSTPAESPATPVADPAPSGTQ